MPKINNKNRLSDLPEAFKPALSKRKIESVKSGSVMRRLSAAPEMMVDKMNFDAAVFGYNNNLASFKLQKSSLNQISEYNVRVSYNLKTHIKNDIR